MTNMTKNRLAIASPLAAITWLVLLPFGKPLAALLGEGAAFGVVMLPIFAGIICGILGFRSDKRIRAIIGLFLSICLPAAAIGAILWIYSHYVEIIRTNLQ